MNSKTLAALKGSIRKWERIVKGTGVDKGCDNCPLCKLFYKPMELICEGCPVMERTGQCGCAGSPYIEYARLKCVAPKSTIPLRAVARLELRFLRSLLPKAKKKAI